MMQKVSFTSKIKFVSLNSFEKMTKDIPSKYYIDEPWSENEIIKAPKVYTDTICDCTAGGVVDGKDVVMFHLCHDTADNSNFSNVVKVLEDKINLKNPDLKGLILGGDAYYKGSLDLFKKVRQFFENKLIPYSMFKGHSYYSTDTNLAYDSKFDTWLISNGFINNKIMVNKCRSFIKEHKNLPYFKNIGINSGKVSCSGKDIAKASFDKVITSKADELV